MREDFITLIDTGVQSLKVGTWPGLKMSGEDDNEEHLERLNYN